MTEDNVKTKRKIEILKALVNTGKSDSCSNDLCPSAFHSFSFIARK